MYYEIILSILHISHSIDHFKLTCQFENVLFQHVNAIIGMKKSCAFYFYAIEHLQLQSQLQLQCCIVKRAQK